MLMVHAEVGFFVYSLWADEQRSPQSNAGESCDICKLLKKSKS